MLLINEKEVKILKSSFKISKMNYGEGYYGDFSLTFQVNGKNGYFQFFIDNPIINDLNYFSNKIYKCIPELDNNNINDLEIYDTNKHYSFGDFENEMIVSFGTVDNNKINIEILLNEEFISIKFNGSVEAYINNSHIKRF